MKTLRHIASKIVFVIGIAVMGVLSLPAAVFFGAISLTRAVVDIIVQKLDK